MNAHPLPEMIELKVLDDIRDVIVIVQDGLIRYINRTLPRHGYTAEELLGRPALELDGMPKHAKRDAAVLFQKLQIDQESKVIETSLTCKDGRTIYAEATAGLTQFDGKPALIVVVRDVTERKQEEEEKEKLQTQMLHTQKLESLGMMAGGIAHDFNNLLMGVMGNISLSIAQLVPHSPVVKCLEKALAIARKSSSLTKQLLAFAGQHDLVFESVDVRSATIEITDMLQLSVPRHVKLRIACEDDIPVIEANLSQLQQLIMNLVINAAEAVGSGAGRVTLTTGIKLIDGTVLSQCLFCSDQFPLGESVFIRVADDGCGIKPEELSRIFDPFYSTKFVGRGLGLASVVGIVKSHGGAIWIQSQQHLGTTIEIYLPVQEQEAVVGILDNPAAPEVGSQTACSVLVIEDDTEILDVTKGLLEVVGYEVHTACDGVEGLQKYKKLSGEIDLVLLDQSIPTLAGAATIQAISNIKPEQRIIMMSGYAKDEALLALEQHNNIKFIQKPFLINELLAAMNHPVTSAGPSLGRG